MEGAVAAIDGEGLDTSLAEFDGGALEIGRPIRTRIEARAVDHALELAHAGRVAAVGARRKVGDQTNPAVHRRQCNEFSGLTKTFRHRIMRDLGDRPYR